LKFKTLKGRTVVAGSCKGQALVSLKPTSFLGGIDPNSSIIIGKNHDLKGQRMKDKVLRFPYGHGSTVGGHSYILWSKGV